MCAKLALARVTRLRGDREGRLRDEFRRFDRSTLLKMAVRPSPAAHEHELLEPARAGDESAFRQIVEEHRAELHAHCYRMLGSVQDAEDALQDTFLRAWRSLSGFDGRSSLRTWLYRIATNVCIDALAPRKKRSLPSEHGRPTTATGEDAAGEPLVESVWVEPYPDEEIGIADGYAAPDARYEQREAVELAFIAALQHLSATQRAVLVLREVLGYSAREVSESLDTSVASVNSALQRARKAVDERLPERSQQSTLRSLDDARTRKLVQTYVDAWASGDPKAVAALLAEDAIFSMPPWPAWWQGRETIASFAKDAYEFCAESRAIPIRASGQLAIAYYQLNVETGRYAATALDVLTLESELIKEITAFVNPELFAAFGLPPQLPAD
jgi:RNA polymerase sigma-70 factor, ECF subfamily